MSSPTIEEIDELLATQRHNVEILPRLQDFVQHQVTKELYNFECNLAVLQLYQLHPHLVDRVVVAKILLKALMNLPATDFLMCTYLGPEPRTAEESGIHSTLVRLASFLEGCQFKDYWEAAAGCRNEFLDLIPGFDDCIRRYIGGVLQLAYHSISRAVLEENLNLHGAELDAYVRQQSQWVLSADGVVTFPANENNQPKPKHTYDSLPFKELTRVMAALHQ